MGSLDPRAVGATILLALTAPLVFDRSMDLLYGRISLEQALMPSWIGFATLNLFLFALIAVSERMFS